MEPVDIVIAGSGIACTTTVIELFRKLIAGIANQRKISITVIEKHQEFWLGIPYGSRSSVNALTITSIFDFFTAEKERELFFDWFRINKNELLTDYVINGGITAEQWLQRNAPAIQNEDWKSVYLPRFIFGVYLNGVLSNLLRTVEEKQLVQLTLINVEVINAQPLKNGAYEVTFEKPDNTQSKLIAAKLVIAIGSAPVRDIEGAFSNNDSVVYINNLYEPHVDNNIKKLADALASTKNINDRNVLIIGSNASSIELLYLLAGLPNVISLINKLVIISKSGLLPYHILDKKLEHYPSENLDRLKELGNYTIETLIEAAMQDIKYAVKDGVIVPHIDKVIGFTIELLQSLDEDAKKQFLGIYGMQLSNLFRRSGADYKGGETVLHETGKLIMLKGTFLNIESEGLLNYVDPETNQQKKYDLPFKVAINCTGANDLDQSSSRLIYNLVHNNIARVNLSGKGFYVNEKFEAAPNLYIMGPLLGGNMNDRIHFWHLENASRLMFLAPFLADCLLEG